MKPPSQNELHEAALQYLTHRPASVAQLQTVLHRRIANWARRAANVRHEEAEELDLEAAVARAHEAAAAVLERLRSSGLLNDAVYAKNRAERLTREGRSRRAVEFDLKKKGIASGTAKDAIPQDAETELAAAAALLRKKRFGAFTRKAEVDEKERQRWLGALARAGFSFSTAHRALRLDRDAAEALVRALA